MRPRPLCLKPVRDDVEAAPFAVRVVDDFTNDEVDFFGWTPTLAESLDDARAMYPDAAELEPDWEES